MRSVLVAVLFVVLICGGGAAQTDTPSANAAPHVVSLSHFIHATNTLEPTLAFYRDVFGIEAPPPRVNANPGDMEATARFYHDVLGLDLTGNMTFTNEKAMADLVGAPANSQYRQMSTPFPGTKSARMEFYE